MSVNDDMGVVSLGPRTCRAEDDQVILALVVLEGHFRTIHRKTARKATMRDWSEEGKCCYFTCARVAGMYSRTDTQNRPVISSTHLTTRRDGLRTPAVQFPGTRTPLALNDPGVRCRGPLHRVSVPLTFSWADWSPRKLRTTAGSRAAVRGRSLTT